MFPKKIEIPTQTILRWLNKDSSKESLAAHVGPGFFPGPTQPFPISKGWLHPFFPWTYAQLRAKLPEDKKNPNRFPVENQHPAVSPSPDSKNHPDED